MELDRNTQRQLGYSTSKGMERGRQEHNRTQDLLHKAVYHYNKMVPEDKVHVVAMVAQAHQSGAISEQQARELLNKYGL